MEDVQLLVQQADRRPYLHRRTDVRVELAGSVHGVLFFNYGKF